MKVNAFIPIKKYSERIPNKNFLKYKEEKLFTHIIRHTLEANCFDNIYIDTDSDEIKRYAQDVGCKIIHRLSNLASNNANGNDLLNYWVSLDDCNCDFYFQLFATAPNLSPETIVSCVDTLNNFKHSHDSIFTVQRHYGFFWYKDNPISYRPDLLPRTQDLNPIIQETTGLYGITRESLLKYRSRIGARPYFFEIDSKECLDIDWVEDLN